PAEGKLGVSVEGDTRAWPGQQVKAQLPELSPYSADQPYLEVFNRGRSPMHFTVSAAEPWLHVSQTEGGVTTQARIDVSVDWQHAPQGHHDVPIQVTAAGETVTVMEPVSKPSADQVSGDDYMEAN